MSVMSEKKSKQQGGFGETIRVVIHALILALVVRTFLFQPFNIPSGSMIPTLLIGDYLFVSKFSYGYSRYSLPFGPDLFSGRIWASEPKRGDVAVFKLPRDQKTDYIKRVIGLPGDEIQVLGGILYINGTAIPREQVEDYVGTDRAGRPIKVSQYRETLPNGVSYNILERSNTGFADNTPVYNVPAGNFFMMGDNRDDSTDSRFLNQVGYVPFDNFVGRADLIYFSIDENTSIWEVWKWPTDLRWSRFFDTVQ